MKKILVVVDVQNDFVSGTLGSEAAQSCIDAICKKISEFTGGRIYTTQDTHAADYLETREGALLPVRHCVKPESGWQIQPEVVAAIASKLEEDASVSLESVEKPTFGSEALIDKMDEYIGTDEAEVCFVGFCTDICVLSNAILAKARFFDRAEIVVDASCCAGVTEEKHLAALEVMKSCQIIINN